jgi:tetratricopeptide (TPR) repeat protein
MLKAGKSLSAIVDGKFCGTRLRCVVWRVLMALACIALTYGPRAGISRAQEQSLDEWTTEHFKLAREAQRQNNLDTAVEEYRAIISRNPEFAGAELNLGIIYHQQRKYGEAVKVLQSAVSHQPDLLGAQVFLGMDEYLVQDLKGARQHLENALKLKPDDRLAGIHLALTYAALDEPEKAAQQLRKTAQYSPEDVEIFYDEGEAYLSGVGQSLALLRQAGNDSALYHWALAIAAEQKSDLVSMIQEYLKALAADPGIAELYLRLAVVFKRANMAEMATDSLERYKLLNPVRNPASLNLELTAGGPSADAPDVAKNKEAFLKLWHAIPSVQRVPGLPAIADESVNHALKEQLASKKDADLKKSVQLYLQGDYCRAVAKLRPRVDRHADKWLSPYLLARCYLSTSNDDDAQTVLETHLIPYFNLQSVALLRVEIESRLALRCFNWVVAHQPDSCLAKLLSAKSYAADGKDKEAIAAYQEALKLDPGRLGIHLAIGQIYEGQLHWAPAVEEYQAELALDSDNAMALVHLGHALTEARDPERAIQALDRLLESNPTDGKAYADLGKAWTLKGDRRKAIAAYEQALRYNPDDNDLHYRLFTLYTKEGEAARAQSHLAAFNKGQAWKLAKYRKTMGVKQDSMKGPN